MADLDYSTTRDGRLSDESRVAIAERLMELRQTLSAVSVELGEIGLVVRKAGVHDAWEDLVKASEFLVDAGVSITTAKSSVVTS